MSGLTAMERLLLPLVRRFVALWVRPSVLPDEVAARLGTGRPVVYALEKRSVIDLAVLEYACRERSLPRPLVPFGPGILPASVLFLERRAGFLGMRVDRRMPDALRTLATRAGEDLGFDADIVPVSLFWGRAPDRERSWVRLWIAEDWDIGGRVRKLLSLLVNGRNLLMLFGDALALQPSVGETRGSPRGPRRLWRQLRTQFRNQRTASIGPDLSHRRTIVAQVLRTQLVREAARDEMKDRGLSRHEALEVARGYAYEIAANYSHTFVVFMAGVLGRLWNRLYDGVELANFASSMEAIEDGAEVVFAPCHRSHMDYLLLSYVIYRKGYAVPHIAAGINLNLPVIGSFLRRGGAFFLRRSFSGNALYTAVFMKYLGLMMARGHSIEYFIEGGRSRTGRLLKPKTGMLAMTVRSYLREPRRPVVFVPVYFGYERLVEGRTYINELSGRPKERESVLTLLRAIPELRSRFGKVYVSFGEPLPLDPLIARHAPGWDRQPSGSDDRPPWLSPLIAELATTLMTRVNAAACVTPVNLLGLVLLATPRQRMGEADLVRMLELYASLLRGEPYSNKVWVTDTDGASMIRYGLSLGILRRQSHELGDIVWMPEENSVLVSYFRNNVLHLMLMPSLLACAFLNNASVGRDDLQRLARRVYPYVADEYFLRWDEQELPAVVDGVLEDLANHGLLTASEDRSVWRRPPAECAEAVQLSVLARATVPIIERYYLAVSLLLKAGSGRLTQDALEGQCQLTAQRMSMLYELNSPEFFERAQFGNFIDLARSRGVLAEDADGRLIFEPAMLDAIVRDAQLVLHEQMRNSILQIVHR
jgi:glycerol-3-phosphate O-acyltransferase